MHIHLEKGILHANQRAGQANGRLFEEHGVVVLDVMSSPGSGKTTLLEKTLDRLDGRLKVAVIEGDVATTRDADRLAGKGAPVVQINTHGACHLDANMVGKALTRLDLAGLDLLIVENVGNLVCPADFFLGEDLRVTVLSVAEGDDKVAKYPVMFRSSQAVLLNKMDLLPYSDFDVEKVRGELRQLNPEIAILPTSARTGEGIEAWLDWLVAAVERVRSTRKARP